MAEASRRGRSSRESLDREILDIVHRRAPVSLRAIAIELWPELAGYAAEPTEERLAAALMATAYLQARCEDLALRGRLLREPSAQADAGPLYSLGERCRVPTSRRGGRQLR